MATIAPLFIDLLRGVLTLFLLVLGAIAGRRLREVRSNGSFLVGFAVVAPLVFGTAGVIAGTLASMSVGSAAVLGAMAASASYIAAPAAVQTALPEANPAISLTAALAITFPFNLTMAFRFTSNSRAVWAERNGATSSGSRARPATCPAVRGNRASAP